MPDIRDRDGRGRGGSRARAVRPRSKSPARALGPQRCRPPNLALCKPCRGPPGRVTRSYLGQPLPAAAVWPARGPGRPRGAGGSGGARLVAARSLETESSRRDPNRAGAPFQKDLLAPPVTRAGASCWAQTSVARRPCSRKLPRARSRQGSQRASGRRRLEPLPEGEGEGHPSRRRE